MAKSDWREVDVASELSERAAGLYAEAKKAYRVYKEMRASFEQEMQDAFSEQLAEDEELKFGYNFGKLSIAIGEKRERKPKKAAEKGSLGDWLKAQRESGRDC